MEISALSPEDLGLPEKFSDFRPAQVDALERIYWSAGSAATLRER